MQPPGTRHLYHQLDLQVILERNKHNASSHPLGRVQAHMICAMIAVLPGVAHWLEAVH